MDSPSGGFIESDELPGLERKRVQPSLGLGLDRKMSKAHESFWEATLYGTSEPNTMMEMLTSPSRKNALKPDVTKNSTVLWCHPFEVSKTSVR